MRKLLPGFLVFLGITLGPAPAAWTAQVDIELFAPAREASRAIQAARRAKAEELAPGDLRLADLYHQDAIDALNPPTGQPDVQKAGRLFTLAAAQARVAETRAIEIDRKREAAAAGDQFLDSMNYDHQRLLPPRAPLAQAQAEYRLRQREAAAAA
ncbi:MAG TPA: hypothetical protein VIG69_13875, partial [Candidatus Methylomirabilis sp.]